jgi:hypothetical protein
MINVMGKKYQNQNENENILIDPDAEVTTDPGSAIRNQEITQQSIDVKPKKSSTKSKVIVKVINVADGKKYVPKHGRKRSNMKMRSESAIGTYDTRSSAVLTVYILCEGKGNIDRVEKRKCECGRRGGGGGEKRE